MICITAFTMTSDSMFVSPLEAIRRHEAEIKRRLAAAREAADALLLETERQADEQVAAAEIDGQRVGEAQRQAVQAEAEREAEVIVARAHTEAVRLQRMGEQQMAEVVARAVAIVIGNAHET